MTERRCSKPIRWQVPSTFRSGWEGGVFGTIFLYQPAMSNQISVNQTAGRNGSGMFSGTLLSRGAMASSMLAPSAFQCSKRISFSPAGDLSSSSLSVFSPTVFASLKSLSTQARNSTLLSVGTAFPRVVFAASKSS
jgi:hypothetical protein